ncbi:Dps family protein [Granulosicoccus antarcticus]|uniref:Metalloregulation DNA-binding stress protein n=1 Tax=Granulosicoccus antarcticus IMCC3135 TaxID=1192854 RepID=A0A2Z2NU28_9GAMM|nr:DNA starvation/stationary phase protection protein [Granulosicoccus antarcticus]ASJ72270.1 Metalloregulation DNA-binding stress protein [Granulosicoccus antarcticus IMCC3135]
MTTVTLGEPLTSSANLTDDATRDISGAMNSVLADVFALYFTTKNFHWHMTGPDSANYQQLLDEQAEQLFLMTDPIAERICNVGGRTLCSISHKARTQLGDDVVYVKPSAMLAELSDDNKVLTTTLRNVHDLCNKHHDIVSASLIEPWIDEAELRTWFLVEATQHDDRGVAQS